MVVQLLIVLKKIKPRNCAPFCRVKSIKMFLFLTKSKKSIVNTFFVFSAPEKGKTLSLKETQWSGGCMNNACLTWSVILQHSFSFVCGNSFKYGSLLSERQELQEQGKNQSSIHGCGVGVGKSCPTPQPWFHNTIKWLEAGFFLFFLKKVRLVLTSMC